MKVRIGSILEIGENRYTITEHIDDGGNGVVWKAESEGDFRTYAIKVLKNDKKDKKKLERFGSECQFCKDTDHKNIVKIFDYVAENGKAYCVMPYYLRNLRTVIDTEDDAFILLGYIIQLCEAIQFIHSKGVVHRDLKPENILVADDGTLVLTDFGIAHFEDSVKTKCREWLGNRRYAAPEQLATDITNSACDIYALGRIINELFTKQNPSGEAFMTIAEKNPLFLPLDSIVQKCRIQNPDLRPSIDEILMEVYLLDGEIKGKLESIKESLYPLEETGYSEEQEETIIAQAVQDILLAQYIFENFSDEKIEELNVVYHRNILYAADESIQNLLFQSMVLGYCSEKFKYEANGQPYRPLNLDDENDMLLYEELNVILDNYELPHECTGITSHVKKLFCSCCSYHCVELLEDIKDLCERESPVLKAPILHIVYILRKYLTKKELCQVDFSNNITINWGAYLTLEIDKSEIYTVALDKEEVKILNVLTEQYNAVYAKAGFNHYCVRFKTTAAFDKFKEYALELSHPYHVFEGDVEKIIQVKRRYYGIVELELLDSFDVISTLAKILGLRSDY